MDSASSKEKWNSRFDSDNYLFGKEPNEFLKEEIDKLKPGKALFVGDGEGRNSVYAASLGWQVDSIDISNIGKQKADKLAIEKNVKISYTVADAFSFEYPENNYDLIAIIYFHSPRELRDIFDKKLFQALNSNGTIILLVYDEEHLKNKSSGPSNLNVLYKLSDIAEAYIDFDFKTFKKEKLTKTKNNKTQRSTVIKFVGTKD